ncbi:hypothetical protein [Pectobacterium zantedeschiae]|uniref:Uncharacterized protein n=1 Tax=Pectobacterium zantedeschiae TaxID=2034769 RepID=A0A9X8JG71_9GAMM|nr:hypothetical protein [Pectobacterium zantedeschiae]RYC40177.1 hypothetical protein CTN06_15735 [Pectobacterium zantedeschiae]RYC40459.1 hypothetical protein DEH81_16210 [Pectobacterium zantedeschiae]RYC40734.1 hypothetical protein CLR69_18085 [Pectobacterium zantedeschiae]
MKEKINSVIEKKKKIDSDFFIKPNSPESIFQGKIPTLIKGVYRDSSPMLSERFQCYGRWENATHGNWLSVGDMEALWGDSIQDELVDLVKFQSECLRDDWSNNAFGLFKENRLSLFAGSDIGNEAIFLLWLDDEVEPEFWVYDANGESRYKNFIGYLTAYLNDDVSASALSWRV